MKRRSLRAGGLAAAVALVGSCSLNPRPEDPQATANGSSDAGRSTGSGGGDHGIGIGGEPRSEGGASETADAGETLPPDASDAGPGDAAPDAMVVDASSDSSRD